MVRILQECVRLEDPATQTLEFAVRVILDSEDDYPNYLPILAKLDVNILALKGLFEKESEQALVLILEIPSLENIRNFQELFSIISSVYFRSPRPSYLYFCMNVRLLGKYILSVHQNKADSDQSELHAAELGVRMLEYWTSTEGPISLSE